MFNITKRIQERVIRETIINLDGIEVPLADLIHILNDLNNSDGMFSYTIDVDWNLREKLLELNIARARARGGLFKGPRLKELVEQLDIAEWLDEDIDYNGE